MPGVPKELVEHALNVDPKAKPVKQPLRWFDEPKRKAISSELHRLENASFIREIKASTWVSNPVIVPKKNTDVQRVCVDYMMSTHASVLVDSVGPPSAEVCRTAASFP
jgi:hypothetical protein